MIRFWRVMPRILRGWKTLGIEETSWPSSTIAVPAGGSCRGVKYGAYDTISMLRVLLQHRNTHAWSCLVGIVSFLLDLL